MANLYQGDNTASFGGNFLTINVSATSVDVPDISKAVLKIGSICKTFDCPEFPLTVNLTEKETALLSATNKCYLAVWDSDGRKRTCEGTLSFNTNARVV